MGGERCLLHICTELHLFVKVGQPVHALELVALQLAIEDGGLGDFLSGVDGWVGQAVALSKARGGGQRRRAGGRVQRRAAAVFRLLVKHQRLRQRRGRGCQSRAEHPSEDTHVRLYLVLMNVVGFFGIP